MFSMVGINAGSKSKLGSRIARWDNDVVLEPKHCLPYYSYDPVLDWTSGLQCYWTDVNLTLGERKKEDKTKYSRAFTCECVCFKDKRNTKEYQGGRKGAWVSRVYRKSSNDSYRKRCGCKAVSCGMTAVPSKGALLLVLRLIHPLVLFARRILLFVRI